MSEGNGTGGHAAKPPAAAHDEKPYQRLWFALARSPWASLVLVPADPRGTADQVARSLAEVGKQLSDVPVTAVTTGALEYGTAVALADLPQFVDRRRLLQAGRWPTVDVDAGPAEPEAPGAPERPGTGEGRGDQALLVSSGARIIISIPAVVTEPLGLATTMNADAVVVCIELGKTRMADARRTVELIGRERIAGCFLVS